MAFILGEQRDVDCTLAFQFYRAYLKQNQWKFPDASYELASSDWWYDFNDPRCPHDGKLISTKFSEIEKAEGVIELSLTIELKSAWEDSKLRILYSGISEYRLGSAMSSLKHGHRDWRYDEFRIDEDRQVIHEIEWGNETTWLIKAREISYSNLSNND